MSNDSTRTHEGTAPATDRAVSEVVSVALLIAIVVLGMSTIVLIAGPQLSGGQEDVEVSQAEQSVTQFDAEAKRVAIGGTSSRTVDLGLRGNGGTLDVDPESGRLTVEYVDLMDSENRTEITNTSMGTVVYENGDTTVGYQSGGVWRSDGNGSMMVSPPEIRFRNETLTMHIVESNRGGSVHSDVQIARSGPSVQQYPNSTAGLHNRVEGAIVQVTIESRYYRAWGRYFDDDADTIVQYDHDKQVVVIQFVALPQDYSPEAGVIATSGPGEIRLEGTGAYIDSYDSTVGSYAETNGDNGSVRSAGEVSMFGDSRINGDVAADSDISIESGSSQIDGNASSATQVHVHDGESVTGEITNNGSNVPSIPPIDRLVEYRVDQVVGENDNDATDAISDDRLDFGGGDEIELTAGEYYLENIDLDGETLVLNTTDGDVTIALETWVMIDEGHVEIEGDGEVRLFVKSTEKNTVNVPGEGKRDLHFYVERDASVTTVDDDRERSTQFLVFGPGHFEGAIAGSSAKRPSVTGVIIAPAGPLGDGEFYIKQGELYGAVMTGNLTLGQNGAVHFDHAIKGERIPLAPGVPRFEYLYIEHHEIEVREG
ncbi:DUF7289 family protein [Halopenitus persicus]|uniref:DUF7289 family protein n=1 Tax=Halopenitus persicus TaxID=1048396 RepID=UPI000BBB5CAA|nr:hypothetical protein [Halopenitus persicus]